MTPGPCLKDEGVRWDTAALLDSTSFKCTAAATLEPATTNDHTVVLQADFYRAGDGNEESFTAMMIVSDGEHLRQFSGCQSLGARGGLRHGAGEFRQVRSL